MTACDSGRWLFVRGGCLLTGCMGAGAEVVSTGGSVNRRRENLERVRARERQKERKRSIVENKYKWHHS